jgi:methyltransferase (TIGR00027 family)
MAYYFVRLTDHVVSSKEIMMKKDESQTNKLRLSDVEETGLLTLYCKAIETLSEKPILKDPKAVEMVKQIDPLLAGTTNPLLTRLLNKNIDPRGVVHIALRAQKYDQYARAFISSHPNGTIVNIGCGLDTRFFRIDDGKVNFIDIDLPEMIATKRKLLKETKRYRMIGRSVLEFGWMDEVSSLRDHPIMFQAEGLFMYLPEDEVKRLVLALQSRFPGSELVCEVVNQQWVQGIYKKMAAAKMKNRLDIGEGAEFLSGLSHPTEMEKWHKGIRFIEQWSYFDSNHKKIGLLNIFARWPLFRNVQYTVHYRLDKA